MKTAIIYHSEHHGNTKKLLDALAAQYDIDLIEALAKETAHLSAYDLIGFASGIYYSKFHDTVLQYAEKNLPQSKKVFLIYTCGVKRKIYTDAIKSTLNTKDSQIMGVFACLGFDTFGPFKLMGGIAKGRPNDTDIADIIRFYEEISKK